MDWLPDDAAISEICDVLQASQSGSAQHQSVYMKLEQFGQSPEFRLYLTYILVHETRTSDNVRAAAGLLLRRYLTPQHFNAGIDPGVLDYVKNEVLKVLGDAVPLLQAAAAVIVSSLVGSIGLEGWPGLLEGLASLLESPDTTMIVGALGMLRTLSQDNPQAMMEHGGGATLTYLIQAYIALFSHAEAKVRRQALACCNVFVPLRFVGLLNHAEDFVAGLYSMATDDFMPIRRSACEGIVLMLRVRPDLFVDRMERVVEYMLQCSASNDELLALEACEFWPVFAPTAIAYDLLKPHLSTLVPVLLKNMIYSEFDLVTLDAAAEEDVTKPDRAQDIEPRSHRHAETQANEDGGEGEGDMDDDDDDDGDDDEGGGGGDDDEDGAGNENYAASLVESYSNEWNLRKSASAAIDVLARVYQGPLLELLMPAISEMMNAPPDRWSECEAGVLALGAISIGCIDGLDSYLPSILSHLLVRCLRDEKALVRKITCWTLGRYSSWVVWQNAPDTCLGPFIAALCESALELNKQVQEAACSALQVLLNVALSEIVPFFGTILPTFSQAMAMYQVRNLRLLYDVLSELADKTNNQLARPEYASLILPALMNRFATVELGHASLLALLECLVSVIQASKQCMLDYAHFVFFRCLALIQATLQGMAEIRELGHTRDPNTVVDIDYLVCAYDVLSALADAVGECIAPLVAESKIVELLEPSLSQPTPDVLQAVFAFIGDMVKYTIDEIRPLLEPVIELLSNHLDAEFISVCNNATWTLGEIAVRIGVDLEPYLGLVLPRLIAVLNRPMTNKNLVENVAITIGRIGVTCSTVAAHLPDFIHHWCLAMRNIVDDEEKASAFRGLCQMIALNPDGVADRFVLVCDALCSWRLDTTPDDLHDMFSQIIYAFRDAMGPESWSEYFSNFPPDLRQLMHEHYAL